MAFFVRTENDLFPLTVHSFTDLASYLLPALFTAPPPPPSFPPSSAAHGVFLTLLTPSLSSSFTLALLSPSLRQ